MSDPGFSRRYVYIPVFFQELLYQLFVFVVNELYDNNISNFKWEFSGTSSIIPVILYSLTPFLMRVLPTDSSSLKYFFAIDSLITIEKGSFTIQIPGFQIVYSNGICESLSDSEMSPSFDQRWVLSLLSWVESRPLDFGLIALPDWDSPVLLEEDR